MSMRHRIVRTGVAAALAVGAIPVCTANAAAAPADPPTVWVAEGATGDGQSSTAPMSPAAVNALTLAPGTRVELTGDQPIRATLDFDARDGGSPSRPIVITPATGSRTVLAPSAGYPGISVTDTSDISLLGLDVVGDGSAPAVQATYTRGGDDKAEALLISGLSATHAQAGVVARVTSPDSGLRGLQVFGVGLDDADTPSVVLSAPPAVTGAYEDVRIAGVRNRVGLTAVIGGVLDGRSAPNGVSVAVEQSSDIRIIGAPSPTASPRGTGPASSPPAPGSGSGSGTPSVSTGPTLPGTSLVASSPPSASAPAASTLAVTPSTAEILTTASSTSAATASTTTPSNSSTKVPDVAVPGVPLQGAGTVITTDGIGQQQELTSTPGAVVLVQQAPAVGGTANWTPTTSTASEATQKIRSMTDKGSRVLLQIGGTATPFTINTASQARHLAESVGTLADKYGFTGAVICLDGAGSSWTTEAVSDAVHQLKSARGSSFTVGLTTAFRGEHVDRLAQLIDRLDQQPDLVVVRLDQDASNGELAATSAQKIAQAKGLGVDGDRIMVSVAGSPDSRATVEAQAAVRSAGAAGVLVNRRAEDAPAAAQDPGTSNAQTVPPSSTSSSASASPTAAAPVAAPTSASVISSSATVVEEPSGMQWLSGASDPTAANGQLAAARGSAITVGGTWTDAIQEGTAQAQQQAPHWMLDPGAQWGSWNRAMDIAPGGMVSGMTWKQAAAGELDDHWRAILTSIRDAWDQPSHGGAGYDKLWIRPFHEANGNWYPWSVSAADLDDSKVGWKRWAQLQREILPGSHLTWCANAGTLQSYDVRAAFPGTEWVDDIGVDFYNNYPYADTAEEFQTKIAQVQSSGGPIGLDAWLQFATSQGKQLAIPEWSSDGNPSSNGGGDAPIFFEQMHAWLAANHQAISREVLFNIPASDSYALFPADKTTQPRSAETYLRLW